MKKNKKDSGNLRFPGLFFFLKGKKKAIIEDWIPLFVSLIIMVLIILFFAVIRASDNKDKLFLQGKDEIEAYQNLNNYLRVYSDLIILRANDLGYETELRERTVDYFSESYGKKWRLKINFENPGNYETSEAGKLIYYKSIKTEIPYFDKNIEVMFYYG